jgi:hypothetical protein
MVHQVNSFSCISMCYEFILNVFLLGCGKSSYITALAGKLECVVCVLNLSEKGLTVSLAYILSKFLDVICKFLFPGRPFKSFNEYGSRSKHNFIRRH